MQCYNVHYIPPRLICWFAVDIAGMCDTPKEYQIEPKTLKEPHEVEDKGRSNTVAM